MKKHLSISIAALALSGTLACTSAQAQTPVVIHSMWCLQADSNSTLTDKSGQGICGALLTGALLASYFSDNPEIATWALTATEKQDGKLAADFACKKDAASNQVAIRLLQVCQCHNSEARDVIEKNQNEAVKQLIEWRRVTGNPC